MTIDTEKLRALSRGCEYTVKATEAGDVSELWAIRFDVMGRPYDSRIGVTSHSVAALIAAAVNTLPELLDAAEDLALWNASPFARLVDLLADAKTENFAATDFQHARSDSTQERWILSAQRAEGKTLADRCVELNAALATAEAERLTLARALIAADPPTARFAEDCDLAARIVAEADAAKVAT